MFTRSLTAKKIGLNQVDWQDDRFRMSYGRPLKSLLTSIGKVGLEQAPILQEKEPGRYRIVAGRRRLRAAQRLGWESLTAELLDQSRSVKELLLFGFYQNLGQREFNAIEVSLILKKLSPWVNDKEVIDHYLPLMNLPPRKEVRDRYLALTDVSQGFWKAVLEGRLFPETVFRVQAEFPGLANLLLSLMLSLRWGFQKQKEFLGQLAEIFPEGKAGAASFLECQALQHLLEQSRMTPQEKGEALRRELRSRLYPALLELEKTFFQRKKGLALDPRTDLVPPPYFEGGRYRLVVEFFQVRELKESLYKINRCLEEGKLDDLP